MRRTARRASPTLRRRDLLKLTAAGLVSGVSVPWFEALADSGIEAPRKKSCILLWMDGGPSQQHTFDPKPKGEFAPRPTSVPVSYTHLTLPTICSV